MSETPIPTRTFDDLSRPRASSTPARVSALIGEQQVSVTHNANIPVTVGQLLTLYAQAPGTIQSVAWSIEGPAIRNYTATTTNGVVTPLSPQDLSTSPITFAWTGAGTFTVTCTIVTNEGVFFNSAVYTVLAPTLTSFTSVTGAVQVFDLGQGPLLGLTGSPDPSGAGIRMTARVQGVPNSDGWIAGIQLVRESRFIRATDGQNYFWSLNNQWAVDIGANPNSPFYGDLWSPLPALGNATLIFPDSPAGGLNASLIDQRSFDIIGSAPEAYEMYLMYRPQDPAIWVPLARLDWFFQGQTTYANGAWSPAQQAQNSVDPQGFPTADFPTWNLNSSMGDWVES